MSESTGIVETSNRVWEWSISPSYDEVPEYCCRSLTLRLLSGPPMDQREAALVQESIVRLLIGTGNRVLSVKKGKM